MSGDRAEEAGSQVYGVGDKFLSFREMPRPQKLLPIFLHVSWQGEHGRIPQTSPRTAVWKNSGCTVYSGTERAWLLTQGCLAVCVARGGIRKFLHADKEFL